MKRVETALITHETTAVYAMSLMCVINNCSFTAKGQGIYVCSRLKEFVDLQMIGINVVEDLAESWYIILM